MLLSLLNHEYFPVASTIRGRVCFVGHPVCAQYTFFQGPDIMNSKTWLNCWRGLTRVQEKWLNYVRVIQLLFAIYYIIIIVVNNQHTDKVQRPVCCNTMKTGLSSFTYIGLYGIYIVLIFLKWLQVSSESGLNFCLLFCWSFKHKSLTFRTLKP